MSIRKNVRNSVKALLDSIPNVTVYESRVYPISTLPCISVFVQEESVDSELTTMNGNEYRSIEIAIQINDKAINDVDDSLDDLADLVEAKIDSDRTLSGLVQCIEYNGTSIELSGDTEKTVGVATLTYTALT